MTADAFLFSLFLPVSRTNPFSRNVPDQLPLVKHEYSFRNLRQIKCTAAFYIHYVLRVRRILRRFSYR